LLVNGGAIALKATPLRGRHQAEPWRPLHHPTNRPLPPRWEVGAGRKSLWYGWPYRSVRTARRVFVAHAGRRPESTATNSG